MEQYPENSSPASSTHHPVPRQPQTQSSNGRRPVPRNAAVPPAIPPHLPVTSVGDQMWPPSKAP